MPLSKAVLGGLCLIHGARQRRPSPSSQQYARLTFGERNGQRSERAQAIFAQMSGAPFDGD